MSEYNCFKCNEMTHCSDLHPTEIKGLELLCTRCLVNYNTEQQNV